MSSVIRNRKRGVVGWDGDMDMGGWLQRQIDLILFFFKQFDSKSQDNVESKDKAIKKKQNIIVTNLRKIKGGSF